MIKLRSLRDDTDALGFFGILPISLAVISVALFHACAKVGITIHPILLEPVFNVWIVFMGLLISACVFVRQFFLLFVVGVGSLIGTCFIYVMYVL